MLVYFEHEQGDLAQHIAPPKNTTLLRIYQPMQGRDRETQGRGIQCPLSCIDPGSTVDMLRNNTWLIHVTVHGTYVDVDLLYGKELLLNAGALQPDSLKKARAHRSRIL